MIRGTQGTAEKQATPFALHVDRVDGQEQIRVTGEMDLSVIGSVDREVNRAEQTDASSILLDLEELEFLDAAGICLLLQVSARSESNGGRLRIARARSAHVQRVMELTGAGEVLPFLD